MKVSLYIHIPFCKKKCDYCDFFSIGEADRCGKANDLSDSYIDSLINEAKIYAGFYKITEWNTIYVGGGTPSQLSSAQIFHLISETKKIARTNGGTEITVEVNPEDVREDFLDSCERAGVNRLSMGIQALDDRALNAVSRGSSVEIILNALEILKKRWHGRLSVDFIAGLPNHTHRSFENQFEILQKYPNIDHVSLYTLTVEENTPLWKKIEDGKIRFSPEKADRMWLKGRNILERVGFFQYEVSNFCKKGFESRHNSVYWKQENYVGVGVGATGTLYDFEKKCASRWTNTLSIPAYSDGVKNAVQAMKNAEKKIFEEGARGQGNSRKENEIFRRNILAEMRNLSSLRRNLEILDEKTLEFEFLMLGFRRLSGVSSADFEKRFGKSLSERIGADKNDGTFSRWKKMRLAREKKSRSDTIYSLNRRGILLLNRFLEELL